MSKQPAIPSLLDASGVSAPAAVAVEETLDPVHWILSLRWECFMIVAVLLSVVAALLSFVDYFAMHDTLLLVVNISLLLVFVFEVRRHLALHALRRAAALTQVAAPLPSCSSGGDEDAGARGPRLLQRPPQSGLADRGPQPAVARATQQQHASPRASALCASGPWRLQLDFAITILSVALCLLSFLEVSILVSALRSFRFLRCLRTVRVVRSGARLMRIQRTIKKEKTRKLAKQDSQDRSQALDPTADFLRDSPGLAPEVEMA